MRKRIFLLIFVFYLSIFNCLNIYASSYPRPDPDKNPVDATLDYANQIFDWYRIVLKCIVDKNSYPDLLQTIKNKWLERNGYNSITEAEDDLGVPLTTDNDFINYLNNIDYIVNSNNSITYSIGAQEDMKSALDDYIERRGFYYGYTSGPFLPEDFSSKEAYDSYIQVLKDKGKILQRLASGLRTDPFIYRVPDDINFINQIYQKARHTYYCFAYDSSWNNLNGSILYNISYLGSTHQGSDYIIGSTSITYFCLLDELDVSSTYDAFSLVSLVPEQYLVFKTLADFKNYTGGVMPYYIYEGYDPNFTPTNVSTITDSQIDNSVTYNDIVQYITNNNGVTHNDVYNYINNYTPSGGGGSDDSGGGNGGINLDWLGSLGTLLGSILNGLGQLINNLLTSIIDTVTSIVDNLNRLISGIGNIIPESFTLLINAVFGWLPDEVRALIIGSVTLMILVGIIKLIRG